MSIWKLRYSHYCESQGRFDPPPGPFTKNFQWAMLGSWLEIDLDWGITVHLLQFNFKKVCDFIIRKPIVLKLSTNVRLEGGVTFSSWFEPKITLSDITWLPDLPSTCLRALNSSPMHALPVESLTLVVAPILAELLHLPRLQGVFWGAKSTHRPRRRVWYNDSANMGDRARVKVYRTGHI